MEALAVVLTGILGLGSSLGIIIDRSVEQAIRQQVPKIEHLVVRIDNSPNYQLVQGRVDRVRLASRGVYFVPFLRVDTLELEADNIAINPESLGTGQLKLLEPLQAAVRVVIKESDLNQALDTAALSEMFQGIKADFSAFNPNLGVEELDITNPRIRFLEENRLQFQATLQPRSEAVGRLDIMADLSILVLPSGNLELTTAELTLGETKLPSLLISPLIRGINRGLDISQLEQRGIKGRVLKFEIKDGQLQLIGFAQIDRLGN